MQQTRGSLARLETNAWPDGSVRVSPWHVKHPLRKLGIQEGLGCDPHPLAQLRSVLSVASTPLSLGLLYSRLKPQRPPPSISLGPELEKLDRLPSLAQEEHAVPLPLPFTRAPCRCAVSVAGGLNAPSISGGRTQSPNWPRVGAVPQCHSLNLANSIPSCSLCLAVGGAS